MSSSSSSDRQRGSLSLPRKPGIGFINGTFCYLEDSLCPPALLTHNCLVEYNIVQGKKGPQAINLIPIIDGRLLGEKVTEQVSFKLSQQTNTSKSTIDELNQLMHKQLKMSKTSQEEKKSTASSGTTTARWSWRDYAPQLVGYFGWHHQALQRLKSRLTWDQLHDDSICQLNVETSELPQYRPLKKTLAFYPSYEKEAPLFKPGLCAALSLFQAQAQAQAQAETQSLQFVISRNALKTIMTASVTTAQDVGPGIILYAYQPGAGAPIVIERAKDHDSTPGAIGAVYEKAVCQAAELDSVYSVVQSQFDAYHVLITGETDGYDPQKQCPIEVKSREKSAKSSLERSFTNWLQSFLVGVQHIMVGSFRKSADATGAVSFSVEDTETQVIDKEHIPSDFQERHIEAAFQRAVTFFQLVQQTVKSQRYYRLILIGDQLDISMYSQDGPHISTHFLNTCNLLEKHLYKNQKSAK